MSAHQLHRSLARLKLRCFAVRPQRVQILSTPKAFYDSLVERCDAATTRVTLSALYWGTDPLAADLAEAVARAARRGVVVNVTLDAARAGRRDKDGRTSVDALAGVAAAGGDVNLVDASGRRGLVGEILGVYHAKACVFDGATLLTGANLSEEYFSTRQDRYVVVRDSKVADWYDAAVRAAARAPDAPARARALQELCAGPAPAAPPRRRRLHRSRRRPTAMLFPTAQVRDLLAFEEHALVALLEASPRCGLSTAYANPSSVIVGALQTTDATVVVPSIRTHGFADATGIKALLPLAHARFAWDLATALGKTGEVREWVSTNQTYHAKGCWAFSAGDERRVCATVVGSSNWNVRSHRRDVELGAVVIARDAGLRRRLGDEWRRLRAPAREPVAKPPAWTALLRGVVQPFA